RRTCDTLQRGMAHNGGMKIPDGATVWSGRPLSDGVPLLIVMHGFGANERDLAPLVPMLPGEFAAACIRAPLPLPELPGGFAWFPITDNPGMPAKEIADEAVAAVSSWLAAATEGVEVGPVVLLGFSQGGRDGHPSAAPLPHPVRRRGGAFGFHRARRGRYRRGPAG